MSRRTALIAITPIAAEQWGMFTAGQLRADHVSRQDVKRLVDDGIVEFADRAARVYRLAGAPEDPELDPLRAAWLQLGGERRWHDRTRGIPDAVVSHRSAAHLRGLGDLIADVHEFYSPARQRPRRTDIRIRIRSRLDPAAWEIWGGLPVSTVPAIINDLLAGGEDESAVAQIVQDASRLGLLPRRRLDELVAPHAAAYGRSGAAVFARALVAEGPCR